MFTALTLFFGNSYTRLPPVQAGGNPPVHAHPGPRKVPLMSRLHIPLLSLLVVALASVLGGCPQETVSTIGSAEPLVRVSPSVGGRGMAMTILLRGVNTQWEAGDVTLDLGEGIEVGDVVVTSRTNAEAEILISQEAEVGFRPITVEFTVRQDDEETAKSFLLDGASGSGAAHDFVGW